MKIVEIKIKGKTVSDLLIALDEIKTKLSEGYSSGFDSNEDGEYFFDTNRAETIGRVVR